MGLFFCKMVKIDWTNQYVEMNRDELEKEYRRYINLGFSYEPFDQLNLRDAYIITPSGNKLIISNIEKILSGKLIFGDEKQIEAIEAAEFFKIAEAFYGIL